MYTKSVYVWNIETDPNFFEKKNIENVKKKTTNDFHNGFRFDIHSMPISGFPFV